MKKSIFAGLICCLTLCMPKGAKAQETTPVKSFEKVIISPHINVILEEGEEESVRIENAKVPQHKIHIEVVGKTLRLYLEGAKIITKSELVNYGKWKQKKPIYKGTMVTAVIKYKTLKNLSIRGEEIVTCKSPINQEKLKLTIYGESKVYFNALNTEELTVAIYGESYLEIKGGLVQRQVYRAYGQSEVNTLEMQNKATKITAYGESNFRISVADRLKISCFGESTINYKGDPELDNGIVIGEAEIHKIG